MRNTHMWKEMLLKNCKPAFQSGFTLIELMMVVAIISILAAIAIPTFQMYLARAKVSELILAIADCRIKVTEAVQNAASPNVSTILPGVCNIGATKYVASGSVNANGVITIIANHMALGGGTSGSANALSFTPQRAVGTAFNGTTDGGVGISSWVCAPAGANGLPLALVPKSCI